MFFVPLRLKPHCQLEYRRISKNGSIVWVQDNIRIIVDKEEKKQLRGVMVDVTKKKFHQDVIEGEDSANHRGQSAPPWKACGDSSLSD